MITISQKSQYALRAVFELAKRATDKPTRISDIAAVQAIPTRFLELILNQLKQAGIVESRRGQQGGYVLAKTPEELTVGDIIRFGDGPIQPVKCVSTGGVGCPLRNGCIFEDMWRQAGNAMADVFDKTTFRDLLEREKSALGQVPPLTYCI